MGIHINVRMKCGYMNTFSICLVCCYYHLRWVIWLPLILYERWGLGGSLIHTEGAAPRQSKLAV